MFMFIKYTHGSLSDEVGDGENIAGVSVDVDLVPAVNLLVLHLNRMHKLGTAIRLGEVVQRRRPLIVRSIEGSLDLGDHGAGGDGGLGGREGGGLDEGAPEGDDVIALPRDIGDGVEEGDALVRLAQVRVALARGIDSVAAAV